MIGCALIACKKNSVSFTYSPTSPKAGETVIFYNHSESGEDWSWSFGDGATSASKAPTHVYKQPGTYHVTLTVDNRKSWRASEDITVYDTVPSFSASDTSFVIYKDYTFTAQVYNPYNYKLAYEWILQDSVVSVNGGTLKCYFTRPNDSVHITLRLSINDVSMDIHRAFYIEDLQTNSVLFRTNVSDYRQRIFGDRAEGYKPTTDSELLDIEQDVEQWYNDSTFRLADLAATFPGIEGFKIANRKIYYRANGLWVANIDGAYKVQIDDMPCAAMTLDTRDSRIYWANAEGVWYMPFVGSDNNKFVSTPTRLNELKNVTKIAADAEPK